MKKIFSIMVIVCVTFCLYSCGNQEISNVTTTNSIEATTTSIDPIELETVENSHPILEENDINTDVSFNQYEFDQFIENLVLMEEAALFDLDSWATKLNVSQEEAVSMLTNLEHDLIPPTFWEFYANCPDIFFLNNDIILLSLSLFPEKIDNLLLEASILADEYAEFISVFQEYYEAKSELWAEYFTTKEAAWEEYSIAKDAAWEKYSIVKDAAWQKYSIAKDAAQEQYSIAQDYNALKEYSIAENTAWEQYSIEENTAWEYYLTAKDTAMEQYMAQEEEAGNEREKQSSLIYEKVTQHVVYEKLSEVTNQQIYQEMLVILGIN